MEIPTSSEAVNHTAEELQEALRPIASLIHKSEKAQQKLAPGTWQHTMLQDNIKALRIASVLMSKETDRADRVTRDDYQEALRAFASMISRVEQAQASFLPGTSQHTLQRNRLKALRTAQVLMKAEVTAEPSDAGNASLRPHHCGSPIAQKNENLYGKNASGVPV